MDDNSNQQDTVLLQTHGAVAHLTLNRPHTLNAVNGQLCRQLRHTLMEAEADDSIHAIVISGNGRAFCAGGDLRTIESLCASKADHIYSTLQEDFKAVEQLYSCRKPTIAAVHGSVVGGGIGISSICDFVYAEVNTKFVFSFLELGILPDMSALYGVYQRVGLQKARRLFMQGEKILAEEAFQLGLVDQICLPGEGLSQALVLAESLASKSSPAMRFTKVHLNQISQLSFAESLEREIQQQSLLWCTDSVKEKMRSMLQSIANKPASK